jgi:hypothetical protein
LDAIKVSKAHYRAAPKERVTLVLPPSLVDRIKSEAIQHRRSESHEVALHLAQAYGLSEEWLLDSQQADSA